MIRQALEQGAVGRLLISESLRKNSLTLQCTSCGHEWQASIGKMEALPNCPSCKAAGDNAKVLKSISLIEELTEMASKSNTEVVYISVDTEEGGQLLHGFGGLAGICRYPIM